MLPNFIVIGAGKAGTTSLWGYLRRHPDVFMSEFKELDFFTTEHNWHLGTSWYESHFAEAGNAIAVGEASGNYANWPEYDGVPDRMADLLPDARLLYVIRDPIERMVSAYRYLRIRGEEDRPMEQAFRERPLYLNVSRYASQIDQYLLRFPAERLLVIVSEDLRDDREATMARVFSFLGVRPDVDPDVLAREYNRTEGKRHSPRRALRWAAEIPGYDQLASRAPASVKRLVTRIGKTEVMSEAEGRLPDDLRLWLEDELRDETRRLREHLGPDFHCWGLA